MREVDLSADKLTLGAGGRRLALVLGVIGVVVLAAAALLGRAAEGGVERFYRAYLINYAFFLSLALGALFFILVSHLTRAGWSISLRRIAEVFAWTLLPLGVLAVVIVLGREDLYEWTHLHEVEQDPLLRGKAPYLNTPFFIGRLIFYFVVWGGMALYFLKGSTGQDRTGDARVTERMERWAAPCTIVFALTVTFAAFDLLMSLYPHWYSTIWGVYYFAGSTVGFFSLLALTLYVVQSSGLLTREITVEHYHDVGKLAFAFVVFWAYIGFSQFMLIWYGNIPEETSWYLERQTGEWVWVSLLLLFGHFIVPFLFLISRHPKRRKGVLAGAAVWLLAMHWTDMYWLVMPRFSEGKVLLGLMEIATFVGLGGLFLGAAIWQLSRHALVPVKDPRLAESLGFENV